jgi:hypothetical protein
MGHCRAFRRYVFLNCLCFNVSNIFFKFAKKLFIIIVFINKQIYNFFLNLSNFFYFF